jgi:hypothetical protein
MPVAERLTGCRAEILARWRELIRQGGPRGDHRLRPRGEDPFHDPIGASIERATESLLDALSGAGPEDRAAALLDELVRIRAVQGLKPSQAVGFVFLLRQALREVLGAELDAAPLEERHRLDARIDAMALLAFDALVACRERLFELRAREAASSSYLLLKRARLLTPDAGDAEPAGDRKP